MTEFLKVAEDRKYSQADKVLAEQTRDAILKARKFFERAVKADGGDDEEAAQDNTAAVGYVPDLISDQKVHQWGGISFGEYDTLLLAKSLKSLSGKTGAGQLRLWGKIRGTQKDYYIAEGVLEAGGEDDGEKPANFEPRGTGVNQYVYWATNSPLEDWTQLADL
jgi:hypothetical protein